jgi:hypothetical protein
MAIGEGEGRKLAVWACGWANDWVKPPKPACAVVFQNLRCSAGMLHRPMQMRCYSDTSLVPLLQSIHWSLYTEFQPISPSLEYSSTASASRRRRFMPSPSPCPEKPSAQKPCSDMFKHEDPLAGGRECRTDLDFHDSRTSWTEIKFKRLFCLMMRCRAPDSVLQDTATVVMV